MIYVFVVDVLVGKYVVGEMVIVKGWVCICCDLKVGLFFIVLYDGSCFDFV